MTINVDVTPRFNEPFEKLLKRFTKRCKKENIVREHNEHNYFKTKRQKQKEKQEKQRRLRQKKKRY